MHLYTKTIKSHPDSNDPKKKEYTATVSVADLWRAEEISTEANPRHQKNSAVYKGIKESLESNDGLFRYKNQGITINCQSVLLDKDNTKPIEIILSDDKEDLNGVINGGHTYKAILEVCHDINESGKKVEQELGNQEVNLRIFSGINDRESIVAIADGQNSSVSVTRETLLYMEGQFDELKSKLPEPWEGKVQFRQNEYMDDDKTPFPMDSRDLLGLVYLMNSDEFPTKSVDKLITRPYSSKASLVNMFANEEQKMKFRVTKSKLYDILRLRDYILSTAESIYNENGGRFGSLRISESFKDSMVVNKHGKPNNTLNRGAFLPIISSFRIFEEKGIFDFQTMKKAWDESGYELIKLINEAVEQKESITEVGKDSFVWNSCAQSWYEWLGKNS